MPIFYFTRSLVYIEGGTPLHAASIAANDLRAGAALMTAALIAEGTSEMTGVKQVQRGYERIAERLQALGAHISIEQ